MDLFLQIFVSVLAVMVFVGFVNEKTLKLPTEIALLISSLVASVVLIAISSFVNLSYLKDVFSLELLNDFLVEGFLCFMLFSGASSITFHKLKSRLKIISVMAIITTILSATIYGFLTYGIFMLLGVTELDLMQCFLIGAIISPTDPIAAMSILRKVGLPKDTGLVIEGESLFNDGVGIALFVAVGTTIKASSQSIDFVSFSTLLFEEIVGAIVVGIVISFLLYYLFKKTKDTNRQIFISLLAVSSAYIICTYFGFSSAIASVVCGIYFATHTRKKENEETTAFQVYRDFWGVIDDMLNNFLYVLLGLTAISILIYAQVNIKPIIVAVICNIIARYAGVLIVSIFTKNKPDGLTTMKFVNLLTWSGLKGALSLALAISSRAYFSIETYHTVLVSVFAVVLFTTLVQGLSIGRFYTKHYKNKTA